MYSSFVHTFFLAIYKAEGRSFLLSAKPDFSILVIPWGIFAFCGISP